MPLRYVAKLPTKYQIALILFAILTSGFFGAGVYAVMESSNERTTNCQQIKEVRDDVVKALNILTEESTEPQVVKARKVIGEPKCES